MRIVDVEQRSDKWKALRRTKIGASNSPAILGKHPFKNILDVYDEMVLGKETEMNPAMTRGVELEEDARDLYNSFYEENKFSPVVGISCQFPFLMASFDGVNFEEEELLEIKCPGEKVFNDCCNGKIPDYWRYQVQHQLLVSGFSTGTIFVYVDDGHYTIHHIPRNEEMIGEIINSCKNFYENNILKFVPPEEDKFVEIRTYQANDLMNEYLKARKNRKEYEELEEALKKSLISLCKDQNSIIDGVKLEKSVCKGSIAYEKIPRLQGIDLEEYRKPAYVKWRISE